MLWSQWTGRCFKAIFLAIFPFRVYPASRGFFLAWLLGLMKSFASLVSRVVGLFYISPGYLEFEATY